MKKLPVIEHLRQLRGVFIRIAAVLFILSAVLFAFAPRMLRIIEDDLLYSPPIEPYFEAIGAKLGYVPSNSEPLLFAGSWTGSLWAFFVISIFVAFILCLPYIAVELWRFFSPAMPKRIKVSIVSFVLKFSALFLMGVLYSYFLLLPLTYKMIVELLSSSDVVLLFSVSDFVSFTCVVTFVTGLIFTTPLLLVLLVRAGIFIPSVIKNKRIYFYAGSFVLLMIWTPDPTPIQATVLLVPLVMLFEVTLLFLPKS
ncbi:MAG: twin-arginine translocase subunit TatC [Candidatus Woesearchaeota archaeon]